MTVLISSPCLLTMVTLVVSSIGHIQGPVYTSTGFGGVWYEKIH
jgi:hypothetical protein